MSTKFSDTLAEAAYVLSGHGFSDEYGSTQEPAGWHGLVTVSPVLLMNVGADSDLVQRLRDHFPRTELDGHLVWIREDSQGFVDTIMFGHDAGPRSGTDQVANAWDAFVEETEEGERCEDPECWCNQPQRDDDGEVCDYPGCPNGHALRRGPIERDRPTRVTLYCPEHQYQDEMPD